MSACQRIVRLLQCPDPAGSDQTPSHLIPETRTLIPPPIDHTGLPTSTYFEGKFWRRRKWLWKGSPRPGQQWPRPLPSLPSSGSVCRNLSSASHWLSDTQLNISCWDKEIKEFAFRSSYQRDTQWDLSLVQRHLRLRLRHPTANNGNLSHKRPRFVYFGRRELIKTISRHITNNGTERCHGLTTKQLHTSQDHFEITFCAVLSNTKQEHISTRFETFFCRNLHIRRNTRTSNCQSAVPLAVSVACSLFFEQATGDPKNLLCLARRRWPTFL